MVSPRKDLVTKAETGFVCLGIVPPLVCLLGGSDAANRFIFNGWAFLYSVMWLEPLLREATRGAPPGLAMKLNMIRVVLPLIACAFLAESAIAKWGVDVHCIVHVLAASHVLLTHSCLA